MRIDIWSDIACPWCYIGLTRFERVLESFEHRDEVEVRLRSFQLDPTLPEEYQGTETQYLSERKGVPEDQIRQMFGHVVEAGETDGLFLDFESLRVANSWRAHRLLHAAEAHDTSGVLTRRLENALFEAHFRDGEKISDPAVLLRIARELGIPDDAAERAAGDGTTALPPQGSADLDDLDQSVHADIAEARGLGISGVPFFVLAGKYGLSGAQPAEVFEGALNQVWEELHPAPVLTPLVVPDVVAGSDDAGGTCGPEGCD